MNLKRFIPTEGENYMDGDEAKQYLQDFMDMVFPPIDSEKINDEENDWFSKLKKGERGYDIIDDRDYLFSLFEDEPLKVGDAVYPNDIFLVVRRLPKEMAHGGTNYFLNTFGWDDEEETNLFIYNVMNNRIIRNIERYEEGFYQDVLNLISGYRVRAIGDYMRNQTKNGGFIYRYRGFQAPPTATLNYSREGFL